MLYAWMLIGMMMFFKRLSDGMCGNVLMEENP